MLESSPLSDPYVRDVASLVAPDLVNDAKPQSQRRLEALLDLYNHVTMAAVVKAVSWNQEGDVDLSMDQWFYLDKAQAHIESREFVTKLHVGANNRSLAKQKRASLSSTRKTADKPKVKIEGGKRRGKRGEKKEKAKVEIKRHSRREAWVCAL